MPGKRDNARNNVRCTQARPGRPHAAWMDRTSVKESIRMTEDRYKWRKYVYGVAKPLIEDG